MQFKNWQKLILLPAALARRLPRKVYYWSTAALLLLAITALLVTPVIIRERIEATLEKLGAEQVEIDDVDFNPFNGKAVVHGLVIKRAGQPELVLHRLRVTLAWTALLKKQIRIERFVISGIEANLRYANGQWVFAGFSELDRHPQKKTRKPYALILHYAAIRNLRINVFYQKQKKSFLIKQIAVAGINSTLVHQKKGAFHLQGRVGGGRFTLSALLDLFSEQPGIQLTARLNDVPFSVPRALAPARLTKLRAKTDYNGTLKLQLLKSGTVAITHQGRFKLKNALLKGKKFLFSSPQITLRESSNTKFQYLENRVALQQKFTLAAEQFTLTDRQSKHQIHTHGFVFDGGLDADTTRAGKSRKPQLKLTGKGKAKTVSVNDKSSRFRLFHASDVKLEGVRLDRHRTLNVKRITTGNMTFANTVARTRSVINEFNQRVVKAKMLEINAFSVTAQKHVAMQSLSLHQPTINLYRDANKWPLLTIAKKTIRELKLNIPKISVGRLALKRKAVLNIYDNSFKPPFHTAIRLSRAEIRKLDTQAGEKPADYNFAGRIGGYTRFKANGNIVLFAKKLSLQLRASATEVELPKYTAYSSKYSGYDLTSGQMDVNVDLRIRHGVLSGRNKIRLRRFRVKKIKKKHSVFSISLPVDTLVKLMSDSKNEIKFTIPNKGDLYDPDFKLGLSYTKAFELGLKRSLTLAFQYTQPVGQAYTVFKATNRLFISLRIRAVRFSPGSARLGWSARRRIKKAAKLLHKKKKLSLRLCGRYTRSDLDFLSRNHPGLAEKKLRAKAVQLGMQRAEAVKNHLVKRHGIDSSRLVLCKARLDKRKRAKPRVSMKP